MSHPGAICCVVAMATVFFAIKVGGRGRGGWGREDGEGFFRGGGEKVRTMTNGREKTCGDFFREVKERERETERETDRDRQRQRQKETQRQRQRTRKL